MPRITSPFRRHSGSWFVNTLVGSVTNSQSYDVDRKRQPDRLDDENGVQRNPEALPNVSKNNRHVSFLFLLKLLLWKNYKLLVRNKLSTIAELLLPLLFTVLIVAIRFFGAETKRFENPTLFEPFAPSSIPGTLQTCCNQIFYTPNVPLIEKLMKNVQTHYFNQSGLNYSFIGFETEDDLLRAYANSSNGMYAETEEGELSSTVLAGIVFTNFFDRNGSKFPNNIEYSLRFPAALRSQSGLLGERFTFGMKQAWFTEILYPIIQPFGPRAKDQPTGGEPGYWTEGFLYLQHALEKELLHIFGQNANLNASNAPEIFLQRFPYPPYLEDEFLVVLQPFLPLTLILSFIYTVTSISKTLVTEKENRIHESMKMMGLTNALHWTAWFITFLVMYALSVFLITVLLKVHLGEHSKSSGLAVLPKSDPTLIFFCLLIHGFQLISFCFFVSSLFKTANGAAITASVLWFMLFLPFPFLQPRYSILSSRVKIIWSVFTNMGICFCCQVFCMFEGSGVGAQWSNILNGVTPDDKFCIADCILVMLFSGAMYFCGAIYVSIVFPGEFGVGKDWYFFFTKSFWIGRESKMNQSDKSTTAQDQLPENISEFYERTPKSLTPGIQVRGLRKTFGDEVVAIDHLNLTMYKNETFCLLGKNGAGKSTLVSVLTGLYPPTSGTVHVNNRNINENLDYVRRSLGVCPQHNVLFEELTVDEHLQFFTSLKGMKGAEMKDEVNRMITAIGLNHKRNSQVKELSGGMKRRLCVGIAFCGGSEVVVLDEPSSGLDVEARRAIWDLIESEKKVARTVLLTTHFMEEAELLADRIAVMVSGRVKCCGSPLWLNKKYNGGYNLTIVMEQECFGSTGITDFITSFLPESSLIRSAGKELTYALPENKSNEFYILFDELERRQKELGVETYGARLTSMEDIFIRVNSAAQEESAIAGIPKNLEITFLNGSKLNSEFIEIPSMPISQNLRNKSFTRLVQQFYAMFVKKFTFVWRKKGLLFGQTIIPMAYLSLVLVVLRTIPGIFDPPPHRFELDHYELFGKTVTPVHCSDPDSDTCSSYIAYFKNMHKITEWLSANVSFTNALLKEEEANLPAFNSKYIIGMNEESFRNGSQILTGYFNNQPLHTPPLALNALTNALLSKMSTNRTVHVTSHPFPYTNLDTQDTGTYWTVGFHVGYNTAFALTFVVAVFATFLVKEQALGASQLQRISGLNPAIYWMANFVVDFLTYLCPCFGLLFIFILFSESTDFLSWELQGYLLTLFLSFGWALIPIVYVMAHFFKVPAVGFAGCGVACAFSGFITILTITVLELPQINKLELATILHRTFLVFPTYALGRGITQMSINKKLQEKCAGFNLEFLCDAAPDSYCCLKLRPNYMDWQEVGIGKNIVYMLAVGIVAIITLAVIESNAIRWIKSCVGASKTSKNRNQVTGNNEEDDGVKVERENVTNANQDYSNGLVLRNLSKSYGSLAAVKSLTVGIKEGECFGLLGTNGAGKTSTFKMLVGEIMPDSGDAFISSYSVIHQRRKTYKFIGYCPQFDALLGELTGRENLVMFARLRGILENEISEVVESLSKELVLEQYLDRRVETYSGGNKRKLSTAVALIGNPRVVFLDEPTAGMDPMARRHVWSAISNRIRDKRTCIILTSHSLEECEVLCTRIAIMKNGTMQCIGSPQQLKHKFGDGFSIVVQIKGKSCSGDDKERLQRKMSNLSQISSASTVSSVDTHHSMQLIDNYMRSHFPANTECILTSSHANYLHYHLKPPVNASDANVSWSTLFRTMENVKDSAGITAYSISQISLEQVFLSV